MGEDIQQRYAERDSNAARARGWRHHPLINQSFKTGLAAGVAYALANLLPAPLDQYAYYAPLGAVTVMYPAVADSIWQALKAVTAVFVGVGLALLTMIIAWPDAFSVAGVVGLGTAIGGLAWFGEQRSWLPLAALFVLTASQPNTESYVLGYLTALPLGALVGILANILIFPSLSLYDLRAAVRELRLTVVGQLRQMDELLRHGDGPHTAQWRESVTGLEKPRARVRTLQTAANRARRGNIRSRRWSGLQRDLLDLAEALERCSFLVEDLSIMLTEFDSNAHPLLNSDMERMAGRTLIALADVFDHPLETAPGTERTLSARYAIDDLIEAVDSRQFHDRHSRLLAGAVAVTASRCLLSFSQRHGVEDSQEAEEQPGSQPRR